MSPFELRILQVSWAAKDRPSRVLLAKAPIPVTEPEPERFFAETFAYPEVSPGQQGQLGLWWRDAGGQTPSIRQADGSEQLLAPVRADDGRTWWIEKGDWKKSWKCHKARSRNRQGTVQLRLGEAVVELQILAPGFSITEAEQLVEGFRDGLWQLILDPASPTTVASPDATGGVGPEYLAAVRDFARHARRALADPHRELREAPMAQPIGRVRPGTRTFQELARRGAPRQVIGRGHAPTFNTPENRQLLAMAVRLDRSTRAMARAGSASTAALDRQSLAARGRAALLDGSFRADPDELAQEIAELEQRAFILAQVRGKLVEDVRPKADPVRLCLRVTSNVEDNRRSPGQGFWSQLLQTDYWGFKEIGHLRLEFPGSVIADLERYFRRREEYRLLVVLTDLKQGERENGDPWRICRVDALHGIESGWEDKTRQEIKRLKRHRQQLERNGWKKPLGKKEQQEQQRERKTELSRADRYARMRDLWTQRTTELQALSRQLASLLQCAANLGIVPSPSLSLLGSMIYVQEPSYRGVLAAFRRAMAAADLDLEQLDKLMQVDALGILDLPMVYERWCLVRLVRVLIEDFGMAPADPGYRKGLLARLIGDWGNRDAHALLLRALGGGVAVQLEYQPRIFVHGKQYTPDISLTLVDAPSSQDVTPDPADRDRRLPLPNAHDPISMAPELAPRLRLTLDAKFHQFSPVAEGEPGASLAGKLGELLAKGYDEGGRSRVFVLHPGRDSESLEDWRRFCRYGGGHVTVDPGKRPWWDEAAPDHRCGAILLRPGDVDPLIRLITMHLYLGLPQAGDRLVPFCPSCRGGSFTAPTQTVGRSVGQRCSAQDCGQLIVRNRCWYCHTTLYKLGAHWTFHQTRALNPYDIKCPHCGEFMILPDEEDDEPAP